MQLLLSFAQDPSFQTEPIPDVWPTLSSEQRSEAIAVLARVLAKTATLDPTVDPNPAQKDKNDE